MPDDSDVPHDIETSGAFSEKEPLRKETRPANHRLPQIVVEAFVRRTLKGETITFQLRVFRLLELTFLIPVPAVGATRVPAYIRFFIDRSKEDAPGSVVIGR